MVNLFDLLHNTGNKVASAKNTLFNKLLPDAQDNQPQVDVLQLDNDGALDAGKSLHAQNGIKPLTPKERLFGRELEQNIQTFDPETNEAQMTTIRDYRPGLFNDIAAGYNENRNNAFSINNYGDNTLEGGRRKGFAYRLGEGLGSLARIGESPLGRSLLVGGLVGATGGSGLEALAYGAQTGMLNQGNRMSDKLYRDDLERQGIDTSGVRGYINKDIYSNMIQSKQLQDNAEWRKAYFDAQQANNQVNREFQQRQLENSINQANANRALQWAELGERRRQNDMSNAIAQQKILADMQGADGSFGDMRQQLDNFVASFDTVDNPYRYRIAGKGSEFFNTLTENEANFNAQRTLLFNQIARKLGGEKGVLSDNDIKRIEAALPTLADTKKQKEAKMRAVYALLNIKEGNTGDITSGGNSFSIDNNALDAELAKRGLL